MESGASAFAVARTDEFDETIALTQLPGESPLDFAHRALERLATAERNQRHFDATLLLAGTNEAPEVAAARRLIALAVAAHAQSTSRLKELVVMAPPLASPEVREHLIELADDVLLASDGDPLPIRICFPEPEAPAPLDSGVFWSPP